MNRRKFLSSCVSAMFISTAGCIGRNWVNSKGSETSVSTGPSIGLTKIADGATQPVAIEFPPGLDYRYIADKTGVIYLHDHTGLRDEPFLDVRDQLLSSPSSWEQGLLGMVLHPNFSRNGRFFVRYSAPPQARTPPAFSHTFVLSEFRAETDKRRALPHSERVILEIPQPGPIHQSGAIIFGPDGKLFIGVGDGGASKDSVFGGHRDSGPGHVRDWYWVNKGGNGQDIRQNLLGSILRIDIDDGDSGSNYTIPDDNPLVGDKGLDEQYAWGFRNPYRMSFDGDRLLVGDVGAARYEEVNLVRKGGNYGWNVKEGNSCFNANTALDDGLSNDMPQPLRQLYTAFRRSVKPFRQFTGSSTKIVPRFTDFETLPVCPNASPDNVPLTDPVISYPHEKNGNQFGTAVIGGYAYRNSRVTTLQNHYIFGDLMAESSGRLFAATMNGQSSWPIEELSVHGANNGRINEAILSFGRDPAGELYVLTSQFSKGSGKVYKISPA